MNSRCLARGRCRLAAGVSPPRAVGGLHRGPGRASRPTQPHRIVQRHFRAECLNTHWFLTLDDARSNWRIGANTTTKNVRTGRSGKDPRLRCSVMMAQPARHHDKGRKTLASGGPKNGLGALTGKIPAPAGPDMGSTSAQLQSIRDACRIWR
jgi:hypothetical protein